MIPKKIHIIWVGDESKRPDNCIQTWIKHHPDWEVRVWGNKDLIETSWVNARHMREMSKRELNGVADIMRWEILYNEGGIVVDADSVCVRKLPDWLLAGECFACWENEIARPGLVAAGYVGSIVGNPFIGQIINDINAEPTVVNDMAWKTVGPMRLTVSLRRYEYDQMTIWPSHFFIPKHFEGKEYGGSGHVFAHQEWGSTFKLYDILHEKDVSQIS